MNISVEIKAPELAQAILALAKALENNPMGTANREVAAAAPVQETSIQYSPVRAYGHIGSEGEVRVTPAEVPNVQEQAPVQQAPVTPVTAVPTVQEPAPVQHAPIVQQTQQQPQAVPTSAPSYSMDQLAVAATQLVDAGKREELVQLLASFGAPALTALPKEQYGAFATKLREMGAKI